MPTIIHMLVEVSVPVPDKDAIAQMVVTQSLTAAAETITEVVKARDGVCTVSAQVKRVKGPEQPVTLTAAETQEQIRDNIARTTAAVPLGDTPETTPVSLPG